MTQSRLRLGLFALAALFAQPISAAADQREADRIAIVAGERAWGHAYVTGDVATVRRLLADDFRGIDTRGRAYDKSRVLADVAARPHGTSDRVDHVLVRFYGDTAVVQANEHVEGPAPEAHPADDVFTDTWVKRDGRWQIVAAEDLDAGLATLPRFQPDISAIRELRAANNRAIAAHDLPSFLPMFADDAVFTWSNGTSAVGKQALRIFFVQDFGDPNFIAYVRSPKSISVSDRGIRAAEKGSWTALKRGTRYGGDYMAHWMKTPDGWRVRGELYVKLYCSGPLCTP
jgi:ketosteroid isomerase-like protein